MLLNRLSQLMILLHRQVVPVVLRDETAAFVTFSHDSASRSATDRSAWRNAANCPRGHICCDDRTGATTASSQSLLRHQHRLAPMNAPVSMLTGATPYPDTGSTHIMAGSSRQARQLLSPIVMCRRGSIRAGRVADVNFLPNRIGRENRRPRAWLLNRHFLEHAQEVPPRN